MSGEYTDMIQKAEAHTAAGDWRSAAADYAEAAHLAGMSGLAEPAWRSWLAAGSCWRREDELHEASRCLRRAMSLVEHGGEAEAATVPHLAAVLLDRGEAEAAEEMFESSSAGVPTGSMSAIYLDTRIGTLLALGRKEAARLLLANLQTRTEPAAVLAAKVRDTQIRGLDGDLGRARNAWRRLVVTLYNDEQARAGVGAALAGLAEVELLLGETRSAVERFEEASAAWRDAGRLSAAWRADARRVCAMVALGVQPLPGLLNPGFEYAEQRGLVPLVALLHLARGIGLAATSPGLGEEDLAAATELSMQIGVPLLVGRTAYERALRLPGTDRQRLNLLDTAAMALVSHVPLAARVALARARLIAQFDPVQAREVARMCLPRLDAMNMSRDAVAARALLRHLGAP
ncbi:MAG: hypothetical protein AB8H79_16345 [Myxococcota bacterium]